MKKYRKILFLFVLIASFLFTSIFTSWADNSGPNGSQPVNLDEIRNADQSPKIVRDEKGNKVFAYGKLSKPSKNTAEIIAKDYFEANDDVIKHRTHSGRFDVDYALRAKHNNVYGKTVMEYHQTYKGIPVYNTTKYVHIDKDGVVDLESGYFKAGLETAKGLEASPKLSSGDALNVAASKLGINLGAAEKKEASLMVYAESDNGDATYTYKVDLAYSIPEPGNWTIFVDAVKGSVVRKINNIRNDIVTGNGIGVLGDSKNFYVERDSSGLFPVYKMVNNNRSGLTAFDCAYGTSSSVIFTSLGNLQFSDSSTSYAAAACDAYTYAEWTWIYYKATFNRNSYNNAGSPIKVGVHYGVNVNNAYSMGGGNVAFGDGDGVTYRNFAADLTGVAHEITHEVVRYEISGLGGSPQPDAIHESLADTFAALVDYYIYGDNINCWIMGKDVTKSGTGLRNVANPPALGNPDHFSSYLDSSDCHVNCGILDKAFYLLSEGGTFHDYTVSGIGKFKTAQIYYRAITNKTIPSNATFHQFYNALFYAADEIYGSGSPEQSAVRYAFAAVGIADFWKITSVSSSKVLDIPWASKNAAVNVLLYGYNGGDNQLWQIKYFSDGYYLIRAKHSGLCLDAPDSSSGVQIRQWYQTSNIGQRWIFTGTGNKNEYYIGNLGSTKYMDVQEGNTADGTPIIQWDFHGGANQRWLLEYVD